MRTADTIRRVPAALAAMFLVLLGGCATTTPAGA
jgi:hypothetical protein